MRKGYPKVDYNALEKERSFALFSCDALKYAELCFVLGVSPEDTNLYEQVLYLGLERLTGEKGIESFVEESSTGKKLKPKKRSVGNEVYSEFYVKVCSLFNHMMDYSEKRTKE